MKVVLSKKYLINGEYLGPGEVDVTDEQANALREADRHTGTTRSSRPAVRSEAAELENKRPAKEEK